MPAKNSVKIYVENGFYHIYNRGVNKRSVFKDQQDYAVLLSYLKTYLLPKDTQGLDRILADSHSSAKEKDVALNLLQLNNFHHRILLLAYILMPNHFHFLIQQVGKNDMDSFMQSSMTRYTRYFNQKYKRVGPLFQGKYKAVTVESDSQMLYLTRYIHRNSLSLPGADIFSQPSSYPVYLGKTKQAWVKPEFILSNFSTSDYNSYESFVEGDDDSVEERSIFTLSKISLD